LNRATIFEGYGHFLMQEAPDEITEAIIDTATAIADGQE
jgi:pimeloyl-ACP methyl ester carboxylesterase